MNGSAESGITRRRRERVGFELLIHVTTRRYRHHPLYFLFSRFIAIMFSALSPSPMLDAVIIIIYRFYVLFQIALVWSFGYLDVGIMKTGDVVRCSTRGVRMRLGSHGKFDAQDKVWFLVDDGVLQLLSGKSSICQGGWPFCMSRCCWLMVLEWWWKWLGSLPGWCHVEYVCAVVLLADSLFITSNYVLRSNSDPICRRLGWVRESPRCEEVGARIVSIQQHIQARAMPALI